MAESPAMTRRIAPGGSVQLGHAKNRAKSPAENGVQVVVRCQPHRAIDLRTVD